MRMKNENEKRPLKKEQLYSERFFVGFCERDAVDGRKIEKSITKEFLDACEKDGFVVPFFTQKETVPNPNGKQEEFDMRYYSPFQIFFVAALSENKVDTEGCLRNPDDWEYQYEHKTRFVNWGGWGAFNADIYLKKKIDGDPDDSAGPNHYRLADEFHQFLRLLHGLDEEKDYQKKDPDRSRYFQRQPPFQYNLDPLRADPMGYLASYELDPAKLKKLVANIGYFASHIDPLERWYYYVQRHPQWRRDTLKGKAALAQDLYGLCDVLYDIIELASGEKMPPLLDFIHPDIKPYLLETAGYAEGADVKAIQSARQKLSEWIDTHKEMIAEVAPFYLRGEEGTQTKLDETLDRLKSELDDYEKRYGDKRYTGGWHILKPEEKLTLDDLDEWTRRYAEGMTVQHIIRNPYSRCKCPFVPI